MLRSRAEGDEDQFLAIALQVAAAEARQGHRANADEIRTAVEKLRESRGERPSVPVAFSRPRGDLESVLSLRTPEFRLSDVVLSSDLKKRLDWVVLQQQRREWLREANRTPIRRLLLAGPPGSGKTMTSEALAGELRLPLFVVRLESLITRFMGETATKLRLVFDETTRHRGVYLFDEFDAVGGKRTATNDVAEMRRVLNSFLQFMEEPTSTDSLLLAATNHPELLDPALQRRFDEVLRFDMPDKNAIREVVRQHVRPLKCPRIKWSDVVEAAQTLSQAEIARAADEAVKEAILTERDTLKTDDLIRHLLARQTMREVFSSTNNSDG